MTPDTAVVLLILCTRKKKVESFPGFSSLPINDRVHLIDCCFMEILVCGLVWRTRQVDCKGLCFAPDLICDRCVEIDQVFIHTGALELSVPIALVTHLSSKLLLYSLLFLKTRKEHLTCNKCWHVTFSFSERRITQLESDPLAIGCWQLRRNFRICQ